MNIDNRKLAVIVSAVTAFISEEKTSRVEPGIEKSVAPPRFDAAWRMYGIQETMEMRRMVQLRFLKGNR